MFKKTFVIPILLIFLSLEAFSIAPPVKEWQHAIGGSSTDNGTRIIPDGSGGFWLLGNTDSNNGDVPLNHGSTDIFVIHTDHSGNTLNSFTYGGNGIDIGNDILLLSNGNLLITG